MHDANDAAQNHSGQTHAGPTHGGPAQAGRTDWQAVSRRIDELVEMVAPDHAEPFDRKLVAELVAAGLKLLPDGRNRGELKLLTAAFKELRYAYRVFGRYPDAHKVTIFGSARTPEDHPDFAACVDFSKRMAEAGWMVITGAGDGIMKAGHVGPGKAASFGVAIRLPFETTANTVIHGDEKLIHFRYFFTRKLMFLSQAEAVALFPGGFGTMDEAYETLTLVQTGKSGMIPIVMLEGQGGHYWDEFHAFVRNALLSRQMISEEDTSLYYHAKAPHDAVRHVLNFYRNYHSSRYVGDQLVIRVRRPLEPEQIDRLNEEFARLVKEGSIRQCGPLEQEDDHLDLPRIVFVHTRRDFGLVRRLIDRINELDAA
ncbi:MAG: Rossman fold protein, TIGR00730 family [Phycisphaerales bacterium]|nr:MAG: Rossman fold protein, TIGR00730 family [Phycisphaerales bacterium]